MNLQELSVCALIGQKFGSKEKITGAGKPGGQTSYGAYAATEDYSITWYNTSVEFKTSSLSDGIVVEGYFLGTYEFDSLTGHPGIKY